MEMRRYIFIFCAIVLFLTGCTEPNHSNELKGTVTSVTDGDTIQVLLENGQEERVRFTLIDTPELNHPKQGTQPFAKEAAKFTADVLMDQDVILEMDVQERDQYGRLLAYVWIGETLFNEVLIEEGYARLAIFPPNTKYVDQFQLVQKTAREARVGIWSIENYVHEKGFEGNKYQGDESLANNRSDCVIKGNENSKIYHFPEGQHYDSVSENNIIWFCTEEEAEKAGFRAAKR